MGHRPVVLIAEDDPADHGLIRRALGHDRYELQFVRDGVQVLEYLMACEQEGASLPVPDLVVLDLNMPRLDGMAVLQTLHERARAIHAPVVVFSSSETVGDIKACYESGCSSYIVKPVDLDDFYSVVNSMLGYWLDVVRRPLRALAG